MDPILRVEDLVKNFLLRGTSDVVHAVNHISFEIGAGETLGLVGESGSGKTTAGRCVLRLIEPTAGRIYFKGQDITRMSQGEFRRLRPRTQMVFQEPYDSLNPRMSIAQIIEENLYLEGRLTKQERRRRVSELLEMVGLDPEYLDYYPHELTSGEQQRVGIARAISTEPDLIVLDEITSALDISVRAEIIKLLKRLQEEIGISYLFISHDLTAVREISQRVAIMYLGEIVEVGPNPEIFEYQFHPYGKALLSSVLYPDPDAPYGEVELKGEIPSPVDLPSGCFLHPRCPFAINVCATNHPELIEVHNPVVLVGNHRLAACWRAEEFLEVLQPIAMSRLH
jgi:oligopeptide transport system ATP-binding protein